MAGVSALRDAARSAVLSAGGRGFVRFLPGGDALLVSDAARRCENEQDARRLIDALSAAGFSCEARGGLLDLTPCDALLLALADAQMQIETDWAHPLFEAMALGERWTKEAPQPLSEAGRRLLLDTARLLWQPKERVLLGLPALRAQAAAMLRQGDRSGLYPAGRLLMGWIGESRT